MTNLMLSKSKGTFTVEFAIVGVIFSLLLVFTGDLVIKLGTRGQLDRMAYSMAGLLKEKSQLFDLQEDLNQNEAEKTYQDAEKTYQIVKKSLTRTLGGFNENRFGYVVDVRRGSEFAITITFPPDRINDCSSRDLAGPNTQDLGFETSWARQATLYQVTLCYDTLNWYGHLLGKDFSRVSSNAIMVGR